MKVNVTDKMLIEMLSKRISADKMLTDLTGLRVYIRRASNECNPNGIHFKLVITRNKQKRMFSLGTFPKLNVTQARQLYLKKKQDFLNGDLLAEMTDGITFGSLYQQWYKIKSVKLAYRTKLKYDSLWNSHLSLLSNKLVTELTPNSVLKFIEDRAVKDGKFELAHTLAEKISSVLDFATFKQIIQFNPIAKISQYIPTPKQNHYLTFSDVTLERDMGNLFEKMSDCSRTHQCLLYMYFFTLLRSVELRSITKDNYFGDYLLVKTKTMSEFKVPLSIQAQKVMKYMLAHHKSPSNPYIFEGSGTSENGMIAPTTLRLIFKKKGIALQVHGIRSCGRQYMQTIPDAKESTIELCLSHAVGNKVQQAYNRGDYFEERKRIMQIWCDFVEKTGRKYLRFLDSQETESL